MEDGPTQLAQPGIARNTTKAPSELERFAQALLRQRDLITALDEKTRVARNIMPSDAEKKDANEGVHLSTLINILESNNRDLTQLLEEIIL